MLWKGVKMLRAALSCSIIISLTTTSFAQVSLGQRITGDRAAASKAAAQLPSPATFPDSYLATFVGLEGSQAKHAVSDVRTVLQELSYRANSKRDGYAAFLVGKEMEFSNDPERNISFSSAAAWYRYGASLGDPASTHQLGMLYFSGIDGIPFDRPKGNAMIAWANAHGYNSDTDRQSLMYRRGSQVESTRTHSNSAQADQSSDSPSVGTVLAVGGLALLGLAIFGGADSNAKSSDREESKASDDDWSTATCSLPSTNLSSGEVTYYAAFGSSCKSWEATYVRR